MLSATGGKDTAAPGWRAILETPGTGFVAWESTPFLASCIRKPAGLRQALRQNRRSWRDGAGGIRSCLSSGARPVSMAKTVKGERRSRQSRLPRSASCSHTACTQRFDQPARRHRKRRVQRFLGAAFRAPGSARPASIRRVRYFRQLASGVGGLKGRGAGPGAFNPEGSKVAPPPCPAGRSAIYTEAPVRRFPGSADPPLRI